MTALRARVRDGPPGWLPAVAVLATVAGGVALGRTGGLELPQSAVLTAGIAVGLITATMLVPPLGLIAFVAGTFASPVELATDTKTAIHFAVLAVPVIAAIAALDGLRRGERGVWRVPAARAALALVAVAVLAAAVGNVPWLGFGRTAPARAQVGGIAIYALSAGIFILGADLLGDGRWLRRVVCVYLGIVSVLIGAHAIPELNTATRWLIQEHADGSLTWTWFAALGAAQVLFNRRLHWRWRLLLGLAVAAGLHAGLVDHEWLAGWMPPLIAVLGVVCLGAPRVGIAAVTLGSIGAALNIPRVVARLSAGDNLYSLSTRLDAWKILLQIVAKDPVLGLGPANYYHVTPLFPIRGYAVNFSSHNTYVDLVAQTGVIGLLCFAWLVWTIARAGWRLRARPSTGFTRAYAIGALGGLAGTLAAGALGDWVFPFVYNVTIAGLRASLPAWLFLGALVALGREDRGAGRVRGAWRPRPARISPPAAAPVVAAE